MENKEKLIRELQLLEDLEYADQLNGKNYTFIIDEDGMIRNHVNYPEIKKVFPDAEVPTEEMKSFLDKFNPRFVMFFDNSLGRTELLPGSIIIDWMEP